MAPVSAAARLDEAARQLRTTLLLLSLPLASAASAFHRGQGWKEFGYARLSDHARERFDRSARWVRDLAALSESTERLPGLAPAITGEDGGHPIGLTAAGLMGKVASTDSFSVWLSLARTYSVRELKAWTGRSAAAGSCWPVGKEDPAAKDTPGEQSAQKRVCLFVPAAVREAFAETLDLYRAVEGHTAQVGEFIESLIAEAASGAMAGGFELAAFDREPLSVFPVAPGLDGTQGHRKSHRWKHHDMKNPAGLKEETPTECSTSGAMPADPKVQEGNRRTRARRWLQEVLGENMLEGDGQASLPSSAVDGPHVAESPASRGAWTAVDSDARMRRLIALHDQLDRQLAEVVTEMADKTAWRPLGHDGIGDYARGALGWSPSTLYARVQLVRRLRRLPVVGEAYRKGDIGQIAAQTIGGLLLRETPGGTIPLKIPATTQRAWVERAGAATIKRLHDETRAVARLMVMGTRDCGPLTDSGWHASLHRQAGTTQRRVETLTRMALSTPGPLVPLRLYLPHETAVDLSRVLAATRRDAGLFRTFSESNAARKTLPGVEGAAGACFQTFPPGGGAVPVWVALLALLQEFSETWDVDVSERRPSAQRIYNRDGWRCMAPGCTSRRNLEVHHIVYRSQGGDNRPGNIACLCRFHHQMGEHGLLAEVRGQAPLGLVWRLGRNGRGGRYRNELRLPAQEIQPRSWNTCSTRSMAQSSSSRVMQRGGAKRMVST